MQDEAAPQSAPAPQLRHSYPYHAVGDDVMNRRSLAGGASSSITTQRAHLVEFCQHFFRGGTIRMDKPLPPPAAAATNFSLTRATSKKDEGSCCDNSATLSLFRGIWALIVSVVTRTSVKYSAAHLRLQYLFAAVSLIGISALIASAVLSVVGVKAHYCDVVVPTPAVDCCVCVCNLNATWCNDHMPYELPVAGFDDAPAGNNTSSYQVSLHGNFFAGSNDVVSLTLVRTLIVAFTSCLSILGMLFQLMLGVHRGNFYMLLGLIVAMVLQTIRSYYSHYSEARLYGSDYLTGPGEQWRVIGDSTAATCCVILVILVPTLRPGFRTLQFQQFGALTTHQVTLRHYNIMFATVLLDLQASMCLYALLFSISGTVDPTDGNAIEILNLADLIIMYLAYQYIRFEKRLETYVALGSKVFFALTWVILLAQTFRCFVILKAKSVFLLSQLEGSTFLGVDAGSAAKYLVESCPISPVTSGSSDLTILFAVAVVAVIVRGASIFYMSVLSLDFGSGVVSSLFFDIVTAKQKEGVLTSTIEDTIDLHATM